MSALLDQAVARAVAAARARAQGRTPLIAVAGAQGAGKSTLASRCATDDARTAVIGLDDYYLTRAERAQLAREAHPLLATRGVPGTHDLAALHAAIDALLRGEALALRAFDKLADDTRPQADWPQFAGGAEIVLVEGWCLGATPQSAAELARPVNAFEAAEDADGRWRAGANARLAGDYAALFARFDAILYLAAPSFEVVLDWRCQQQEEMLGRPISAAERAELSRFVAHFERIARHMLAGGVRADVVVKLDERRNVVG